MEKRILIALMLSAAVLFGFPHLTKLIFPQKEPVKKVETAAKAEKEAPAEAPSPAFAEKAKPTAPTAKEEFTTVETPLFRAVFSNVGGGVKKWELKKYSAALKDAKSVNLSDTIAWKSSLKTVVTPAAGEPAETITFRPAKTELTVGENDTAEFVYAATTKTGLTIEKKYIFTGSSYFFTTELNIINPSSKPFAGTLATVLSANTAGKDKSGYHTGPIVNTHKGKIIRPGDKDSKESGAEKPRWFGVEDKFFLSAIIPAEGAPVGWAAEVAGGTSSASLTAALNLAPGAKAVVTHSTFLGPKEYDLLVKQKNGIEEAIEFGMFDFMAKPFLVVLNFFDRYLGNYGLAIIILTFITKIVFYPLTKHGMKSMKEMQKIQPQLAAIKEKYKDNKEKLNKEMMELYKRYKINPMSGCLPMVLQIPVFIALYEVLYVAIELRHAPFYLWIRDLSDKDPYYITPLVMGATMFIQQKMTPTSMDPTQSKIMLIMPVVFTFMFLSFPSGLVIYWLVNNILSIIQQYFINKSTTAKA